MASHATALLWPRPDFLGGGWGRETNNTFLELNQLSALCLYLTEKSTRNSKKSSQKLISAKTEMVVPKIFNTTKNSIQPPPGNAGHRKSQTKMEKLDEDSLEYLIKADVIDFDHLKMCLKGRNFVPSIHDTKCNRVEVHQDSSKQKLSGTNGLIKFNEQTLEIFMIFDKLKIPYDTEVYRPKEQRLHIDPKIFYCKNVFLKDRKGKFYLVICHEDIDLDLKELRKDLKAYRNFNFVTTNEMEGLIKTEPGGVTPLALIYDTENLVQMVISNTLVAADASLMFHPMDSSLATQISLPSLLRYLRHVNHKVQFIK